MLPEREVGAAHVISPSGSDGELGGESSQTSTLRWEPYGRASLEGGTRSGGGEKTETLEAAPPRGAFHKSKAAQEDCKMRQRSAVSGRSEKDVTGDLDERGLGAGGWTVH